MSRGIDWASIHERLDRAEQALAAAPTADEVVAMLRERARALAQRHEGDDAPTTALRSVLVVGCAGGKYGLDSELAAEILPLVSVTRIARAAPFVAGVANRRGDVLLLVDLAALLGLARTGIADLTKVIVVGSRGHEVGLLVEAVEGIEDVDPSRMAPPIGAASFITGIVDGRLVLVDVAGLLAEHGLSDAGRDPASTVDEEQQRN